MSQDNETKRPVGHDTNNDETFNHCTTSNNKRKRESQDLDIVEPQSKMKKTDEEHVIETNRVLTVTDGSPDVPKSKTVAMREMAKKEREMKKDIVKKEKEEAYQQERMSCIQNFVNISMSYAQFLEKKIDKRISKGKVLVENNGSNKVSTIAFDLSKEMKFFEGGSLRPYQIEGVTWLTVLFENSINGILADEMGLGKTIQIIALICHLYERKVVGPFLIVAPLSTLGNWEAEWAKFAPKIPVIRVQGIMQDRKAQMEHMKKSKFKLDGRTISPVVLTSYQVPTTEHAFFMQFKWEYIIVDEGHRIKNPESRLSLDLRALKSHNRLLLTGTPLQNNIRELWALFNFLMPELFKDIHSFSQVLLVEDVESREKVMENEAQTKIIATIHKVLAPFMLRREKKYVLTDLVPKKEIIIYCTMTEMQRYIYKAVLKKDFNKLLMRPEKSAEPTGRPRRKCSNGINYKQPIELPTWDSVEVVEAESSASTQSVYITTPEHVPIEMPQHTYKCRITMQNIMMMLKKVVNHPFLVWLPFDEKSKELIITEDIAHYSGKMKVLDVLLPKLLSRGHKVLIFSTFVMMLDLVEDLLNLRGLKYCRLDGSTDYDDRNENIKNFQTEADIPIFLLSTRAGGLGLNLTAADTVIFIDRDWNPMIDLQAEDRCHRIGQTQPVMVYSLICKNTIDERILEVGTKKRRLEKVVLKEGEFKTITRPQKDLIESELRYLDDLFKKEEKAIKKIYSNGLVYSDAEIEAILDRSELFEQMKEFQKENAFA